MLFIFTIQKYAVESDLLDLNQIIKYKIVIKRNLSDATFKVSLIISLVYYLFILQLFYYYYYLCYNYCNKQKI